MLSLCAVHALQDLVTAKDFQEEVPSTVPVPVMVKEVIFSADVAASVQARVSLVLCLEGLGCALQTCCLTLLHCSVLRSVALACTCAS